MNMQVRLGTYKVIAFPGLELLKVWATFIIRQRAVCAREYRDVGNALFNFNGVEHLLSALLCISNHENRIGITLNIPSVF